MFLLYRLVLRFDNIVGEGVDELWCISERVQHWRERFVGRHGGWGIDNLRAGRLEVPMT